MGGGRGGSGKERQDWVEQIELFESGKCVKAREGLGLSCEGDMAEEVFEHASSKKEADDEEEQVVVGNGG